MNEDRLDQEKERRPPAAAAPALSRNARFAQALNSAAERLAQRGASAAVTFLVAVVAAPTQVGWYSLGMLGLTLFQSAADASLRQVAGFAWRSGNGERFLASAARAVALIGPLVMTVVAAAIGLVGHSWLLFAQILPLAVVPIASGVALRRLTLAQQHREWKRISRAQTMAAVVSLLAACALLPFAGIAAATAQSAVAETVFAVAVLRMFRNLVPVSATGTRRLFRDYYLAVASSNVIALGQSQAERFVLGLAGGPARLGTYSLSANLTRTAGDAIAAGLTNHLRTELTLVDEPSLKLLEFRRTIVSAIPIALAVQIVATTFAATVGRWILPSSWDPALALVPILGVGILPGAITACTTAFYIDALRGRTLTVLQGVGVLVGAAVGLVLANSLLIGAVASVGRELAILALRLSFLPGALGRRQVALLASGMVAAALICAVALGITGLLGAHA